MIVDQNYDLGFCARLVCSLIHNQAQGWRLELESSDFNVPEIARVIKI
jgi:hypothetical protein